MSHHLTHNPMEHDDQDRYSSLSLNLKLDNERDEAKHVDELN